MTEKEAIKILGLITRTSFNSDLRGTRLRLEAIDTVVQALEQKDKEIQELKKYDIRNIKIDKDKIISSPSFTRKEVDLMNLGIALNLNADKLFNEESEEDDI